MACLLRADTITFARETGVGVDFGGIRLFLPRQLHGVIGGDKDLEIEFSWSIQRPTIRWPRRKRIRRTASQIKALIESGNVLIRSNHSKKMPASRAGEDAKGETR